MLSLKQRVSPCHFVYMYNLLTASERLSASSFYYQKSVLLFTLLVTLRHWGLYKDICVWLSLCVCMFMCNLCMQGQCRSWGPLRVCMCVRVSITVSRGHKITWPCMPHVLSSSDTHTHSNTKPHEIHRLLRVFMGLWYCAEMRDKEVKREKEGREEATRLICDTLIKRSFP